MYLKISYMYKQTLRLVHFNIVSNLLVNTEQMNLFSRLALAKPIPLKMLVSDTCKNVEWAGYISLCTGNYGPQEDSMSRFNINLCSQTGPIDVPTVSLFLFDQ